jgi:hypothetical protein
VSTFFRTIHTVRSSLAEIKAIAKSADDLLIFALQLPSNIVSLFKHFGRKRFQYGRSKPRKTSGKFMKKTLFIFSIFLMSFLNSSKPSLSEIFLDIDITDTSLYDKLSRNKHLVLFTDKNTYNQDGLIKAKYKSNTKLYTFADSIHIKIWRTLSFTSPDNQGKYSNIKSGHEIKLFIYSSSKSSIDTNYINLKRNILDAIQKEYPNWLNHEGASEGVYFLTDGMYPFVSIYRDMRKTPHIVIEMNSVQE